MVSRSTAVAATARGGLARIQARGAAHEQQPHQLTALSLAQAQPSARATFRGDALVHKPPESVQLRNRGLVVGALCAWQVCACSMQGPARSRRKAVEQRVNEG